MCRSPTLGRIAFLPILAFASPFAHLGDRSQINRSDDNNSEILFPYSGDVLNITKCYYEEEYYDVENPSWGSYYQYPYFNWHSNKTYVLPHACVSTELSGGTTMYKRNGKR